MARRRKTLWTVAILLLGLAGGEGYWRLTEPSERVDTITALNSEQLCFQALLNEPEWRRRIGYDAAQAAESERRDRQETLLFYGLTNVQAALLRLWLPTRVVSIQERARSLAAACTLEATIGEYPVLTAAQRRVLRGEAARREGPFLMVDPKIGEAMALTSAQQDHVWEEDLKLRRGVQLAREEERIWGMRFEGAPEEFIGYTKEFERLSKLLDRLYNDEEAAERVARRLRNLPAHNGYTPSRTLPRWLRERRASLTLRRLWAERRQAEARLLAFLTPSQRSRWEEICRG